MACSLSLAEKVLYRGWLPVDDELDDTPEDEGRLHLEALTVIVRGVLPQSQVAACLHATLASLQALAMAHQAAHWGSLGGSFYGDHLMFQRMYESTAKEIDQVAERLVGLTGDATCLEASRMLQLASVSAKELVGPGDPAGALLVAEKRFCENLCKSMDALRQAGQMTVGVDNMLAGIADRHEENQYLLSRRAACHGPQTEGRKRRKRKRMRSWDIGGPISTGPGNPGFGSSGSE